MIIAILLLAVVIMLWILWEVSKKDGIGMFLDADPYIHPNVSVNRYRDSYKALCDNCIMREKCGIYQMQPIALLTQIEECSRYLERKIK